MCLRSILNIKKICDKCQVLIIALIAGFVVPNVAKRHLWLAVVARLQQLGGSGKEQEHALRTTAAIVFPLSLNLYIWKPILGN